MLAFLSFTPSHAKGGESTAGAGTGARSMMEVAVWEHQ